MNEISPSEEPLKDSCLASLLYLKLAMAGDMESADLLNQILERYHSIAWADPGFIADSEKMRGTAPVLPFDLADIPLWRALVHVLTEQLAARDEMLAATRGAVITATEALKKSTEYERNLFRFTEKLLNLNREMRDRLETLGSDVLGYVIPELPPPPQH